VETVDAGKLRVGEDIRLPELAEIESWQAERCELERNRLRNELAFIHGDRAHGGPPRENFACELKTLLAAIENRIRDIRGYHLHRSSPSPQPIEPTEPSINIAGLLQGQPATGASIRSASTEPLLFEKA
jgi:hypothetical protein